MLEPADLKRLLNQEWVATEKVHGANVCFRGTRDGLTVHKRKAPLEPGESFFGVDRVLTRHQAALAALISKLLLDETLAVAVYGELFGGHYPHPEVEEVDGVQAVQSGVWYCPEIEFVAFDIALETATDERFLDFEDLQQECKAAGLPVLEPVIRGKFHSVWEFPLGFDSLLPAALGHPPLDSPNRAEGLVLRTLTETAIPTGKGEVRAVIKRKLDDFAEDSRYHQAQKWEAPAQPQEPLSRAESEAWARLNPNRLQSAVSKWGPQAGLEILTAEVRDDILEELHSEGFLLLLTAQERELLGECLAEAAKSELRDRSRQELETPTSTD